MIGGRPLARKHGDTTLTGTPLSRRAFLSTVVLAGIAACRRPASPSRGVVAWGGLGSHRGGEFQRPRAVCATADEVFVIDTTGRVQVFTHTGEHLRTWRLPEHTNGTPTAIRHTDDGRIVIPDTHYSRILEYSPAGELLRQWGTYGTGPEEFIYPTGIAQGPDGAYYISEYGMGAERVHVFDADRRFLRQWGDHGNDPGQFSRAMAIEVDPTGVVYVCDTANHRVQRFTGEGVLIDSIGVPGTEPGAIKFAYDIALAPDGSLICCEYGNNRVSRFDHSGTFLGCFGRPGRDFGEFNGPRGVAVSPDGHVFIADTDNHRIQRLQLEDVA